MNVLVLGPIEVLEAGRALDLGGPKPRTVLAVLVVNLGKPVSTDLLVDAVYGEDAPVGARRLIQTYVSGLRRVLGDVIRPRPGGYVLTLPPSAVDAWRMQMAVESVAGVDPASALTALEGTLGEWRGHPYGDVDAFGFLDPEITRLLELRVRTLEERVEAALSLGRHRQLIEELEAFVLEHPLNERFRAQLMTALYRSGRQAEALRAAAVARTYFADELGLDAPPAVARAEQQILDEDPALDFKPRPIRRGLPIRYSSFIGRGGLVHDIVGALTDHRLVTVVGVGGVGKSSVAVEAARLFRSSSDLTFVDVESVKPGDLATAVAEGMGLDPTASDDPLDLIVSANPGGLPLLLLDGCEHVVGDVAELADRVLTAIDGLRILVTSREVLKLGGEFQVQVSPMSTGLGSEAEALFCARAGVDLQDLNPSDLESITEICSRLDGIPLAIEIGAARSRSMSLSDICSNLDRQVELLSVRRGGDSRHSSLRGALEWSYQLLDGEHRQAFRRLGVFTSGIPPDGARVVLDTKRAPLLLAGLVDSSLLAPPGAKGRCHMLEPVRQYAQTLLEEADEMHETRDRHCEWVVALADELGMRQYTPPFKPTYQRLQEERSEIIEAMRWSIGSGRPDAALAITAALGRLWVSAGDLRVIHELAIQAIEHPLAPQDHTLARAMAMVAWMHDAVGDYGSAIELIEKAHRLLGDSTNDRALFDVLGRMAAIPSSVNPFHPFIDPIRSLELWERATGHAVRAGFLRKDLAYNRAVLLSFAGRLEESESVLRQQLKSNLEEHGDTDPNIYAILAEYHLDRGELDEAISLAREAAEGFTASAEWRYAAWAHTITAWCLDVNGRSSEAATEMDTAQGIRASLGLAPLEEHLPVTWSRIHANQGQWSETAHALRLFMRDIGRARGDPRMWDEVLRGDLDMTTGIVPVLKPLAQWLLQGARCKEAASLAAALPGLMRMTPYQNWDKVGELQFWEQLATELAPPEEVGPTNLKEAFDWMERALGVEPVVSV